ncbi:hypothetical protein GOP47_0011367 [Adiantum capillus-veneris]|uniref:Uncharacterized protein n=1 Tax=Adiantum capillus-veneris TaxID=13818 RepID=A0A9D4USN1_ADICA|nr:hypothetical protein GOP47_0011367 [Adiantum capillus-veneris]
MSVTCYPRCLQELILNVTLEEPELVAPAEGDSGKDFFLSNIDRILTYTVETVHFFDARKSGRSTSEVGAILKNGLAKLLSGPYSFMAGRLRPDPATCRLSICCNGKGALFAKASAHHSLLDLGDVSHPSFQFKKLVLQAFDVSCLEDLPLLLVQVTTFDCGGFVIGLGTNHTLVDGMAAVEFMQNYAAVVRGEGLAMEPQPDRSALKARLPPCISYPHNEFIRLQDLPPEVVSSFAATRSSSDLSGRMAPPTAHLFRTFPLSKPLIDSLKQKALKDGLLSSCSSFDVITALVWKARSIALSLDASPPSTLFFAIDIRSRLEPPLPAHFCGNGVFSAHASATSRELQEMPFSSCVKLVQDAIAAVTDDYVRSALDWGEINHGVPAILSGCFFVAAWWKLGFHNVDFGWGKPFYCGPVVNGRVEFVLLLPHTTKDSCCIYLALEPHQMKKFEEVIYEA